MTDKEDNTNKSIRIYDDLLEKIIQLEYMPGEKISENELCALYHTTRHNVRGALSKLKEKGFVDIIPQSGTFVSLLKIEKLKQTLFIREAVEQEAFYEIITNGIDPKYLRDLIKNVEKQKKMVASSKNMKKFYALNDEFHILLVDAIGKKDALGMLMDAYMHTQRWVNMGINKNHPVRKQIADHEKIIKAIEDGKWKEGRDTIHNHIEDQIQLAMKVMNQQPKYFA